jgi:hypothetical protein
MFFHFVGVEHRADRERDLGGATQRIALALDRGFDAREILLSGAQQLFALAAALRGEIGIAADHQPFARKIGGCDARHVALIKQRELQSTTVQQFPDRGRTQRGDPVQACGFDVLGDARLGDHAAVADQHDMAEAEALLELLDLGRQRRRIAGVAVNDLDGNRASVRGAEQTVDDLQHALLAITVVATFGQRTAASLYVARRDVVEHLRIRVTTRHRVRMRDEHAVLEVALGQCGLDGGLALQQPVQRGIEFGVIDAAEPEHFAEAGGCRGG